MIPNPNRDPEPEARISAPQRDIFVDALAARKHLEALRWPDGPFCPHCLNRDSVHALGGRCRDAGIYFCPPCRKKFSVRVGTVYERSHVPLNKWLLAVHLMANAEGRFTANLLSRVIGIQYRSASAMAEHIKHAMYA